MKKKYKERQGKNGKRINGTVYLATFPNGKSYVGQTYKKLEERKKAHRRAALGDNAREVLVTLFNKAIKKYGWDCITWKILETNIRSIKLLNDRETFYIKKCGTMVPNGYNLKSYGEGHLFSAEAIRNLSLAHIGNKHTKKTKRKIALTSKEHWKDPIYRAKVSREIKKNRKPVSKEAIGRLRAARLGKTFEQIFGVKKAKRIKKLHSMAISGENHPNFGKHRSKETRERIRKANLGKVISEETREKISKANIGRKHTKEEIEKIRITSTGRRRTKESIRKMLETRKFNKERLLKKETS